ncbi:hypothetical protein ACQCT6_09610 [Cytobacillus gottheilii]|uniref:Uncharacterized protein n=1 Tax=Cytobacillus gottheilii TaxID=859144 RepID=A0ABX8FH90_9BACI|nr:hypothetical protein [Cytobacillus gottheilii]QVY63373.1 hypothetical protein J1899_10115 [Cytobacillus gottheilii]
MPDQERSNFRVSVNGEEMTGTDAQEFAQNLATNLAGTFSNFFSGLFGNITGGQGQGTGSANQENPLSNLSNILGDDQSGNNPSNPLNLTGLNLNNMLPVFETSDDNNKIKMSWNGNTLFDLDLTNLQNSGNNNSNNS